VKRHSRHTECHIVRDEHICTIRRRHRLLGASIAAAGLVVGVLLTRARALDGEPARATASGAVAASADCATTVDGAASMSPGDTYMVIASAPVGDLQGGGIAAVIGPVACALGGDIPAVPGDTNGDRRVDLADHAALASCLAGPGSPVVDACQPADLTGDDRVDLSDAGMLMREFSP